ncbi:MAG: alpha/beta fold hydrolase [Verrucomicrobia bacterium]|nr:alpha/beta fold hydrolase [Verrucomicrobiota bacterium]
MNWVKTSWLLIFSVSAFTVSLSSASCQTANRKPERIDRVQEIEVKKGEILNRTYFFKEANKEQSYSLYLPKSYHATTPSPLVVLLHGLRSNPSQIMRYQGIVAEAEKRGYVLVAPYGYNERGWYGSRGKGKEGFGFGKADDPDNLGELSEKDVINVLEIVKSELTIDSKRVFILGHSMGGGGALHLAATYPQKWAGIACLAPSFQGPTSQLQSIKNIPAIVITGSRDLLVPVKRVRPWVEEMKRLEMKVSYKEIKGGRHFRTITRNPEMISEVFNFLDIH